jgi:hypothetical protein
VFEPLAQREIKTIPRSVPRSFPALNLSILRPARYDRNFFFVFFGLPGLHTLLRPDGSGPDGMGNPRRFVSGKPESAQTQL